MKAKEKNKAIKTALITEIAVFVTGCTFLVVLLNTDYTKMPSSLFNKTDIYVEAAPNESDTCSTVIESTESVSNVDTSNEDWNLILVNRANPVPENYTIELTDLSNGKQVDSRIYPDLQAMFDDARADGLDLFVREGYRTYEDQQALMDERITAYENEGYSYEEAIVYAEQYVALPGTSEHELGICVDINANEEVSSSDEVYSWLNENAYKYGFIKRYPENKTDITGINNEPWHYRYVGKDAAKIMKEQDLCLEEYLLLD